jgi:hypothetical protein
LTGTEESGSIDFEAKAVAALKTLPVAPDQLLWTLRQADSRESVWLIAARRDRILPWIGFFEELDHWPEAVIVRGFSAGSGEVFSGRHLEIRRDCGWYDLRVVKGTKLVSSRVLPLAGEDRPESRLLEECRSILAESEPDGALQSISASGLGSECRTALSDAFALPVHARDPADPFADLGDDPRNWEVDLCPPEVRKARFSRTLSDECSRMVVGFGVLSAFLILLGGVQWLNQYRNLVQSRSEISELAPRAEKIETLLRKNGFFLSGQVSGEAVLGTLCEVIRCVPQGTRLRSLSYRKNGEVILQGNAPALSEVMSLMGRLGQSAEFSGLQLTDSQAGKGGGDERVDFEIRCSRRGAHEKTAG